MRRLILALPLAVVLTSCDQPLEPIAIVPAPSFSTTVPGHQHARYDQDGNGYPDEGVTVTGVYSSVYAYDASEDWYWDLGDGRVYGTVGSLDELDQATRTTCDYRNQYRGTFGNDPFMDTGWIKNNIRCHGYDDNRTYNYGIVHETDPRYRGIPEWSIWGTWEFHVLTVGGFGNLVRPENHLP